MAETSNDQELEDRVAELEDVVALQNELVLLLCQNVKDLQETCRVLTVRE